jgi:L-aspartate oxidase
VAKLIIQCARLRKESRGLHYNMNYPNRYDRNWLRDTMIDRFSSGF